MAAEQAQSPPLYYRAESWHEAVEDVCGLGPT